MEEFIKMEIAYVIGREYEDTKLKNFIGKSSIDGVVVFGEFINYIFREYCTMKHWSIYDLLEERFEELQNSYIRDFDKIIERKRR